MTRVMQGQRNHGAAVGALPDAAMKKRMIELVEGLPAATR